MEEKETCSFCGLTIDDVKHMVAGPDVYICNECIELCMEIWQNVQVKEKKVANFIASERIANTTE